MSIVLMSKTLEHDIHPCEGCPNWDSCYYQCNVSMYAIRRLHEQGWYSELTMARFEDGFASADHQGARA